MPWDNECDYRMLVPAKESESELKLTYFHELIELYLMLYRDKLTGEERHKISKSFENDYARGTLSSEKQLEFKF